MGKRSRNKRAADSGVPATEPTTGISLRHPSHRLLLSVAFISLLLAVIAFAVYWPSLKSDFVYDAHVEIFEENYVTTFSNLPDVLSLKVISMNVMLGSRPFQLLFMMFNTALWGKEPFGFHLASNLLHATNVALLFIFLCRLIATELGSRSGPELLKARLAAAALTLLFALHPVSVESVAEISYSSSLLVMFFTLVALLLATWFQLGRRMALIIGGAAVLCTFLSIASKESGIATAFLLVVYWFLFRRQEAKAPWFFFLGAAIVVSIAFLGGRLKWGFVDPVHVNYLGGSFAGVFSIQPILWVFMMGKLVWPVDLSADYHWEDMSVPALSVALAILASVLLLQGWLAWRSRIGAMGVAVYWLSLAAVSNFMPLNHPIADRYYYLPLAGVAMQLLGAFLLISRTRVAFWMALAPCVVALIPLTLLTLRREAVFASDEALWNDTLRVSPHSPLSHSGVADTLAQKGNVDSAIAEYRKALELAPEDSHAGSQLGILLSQKGQVDEALVLFEKAVRINPNISQFHNNLAITYFRLGRREDAVAQFEEAVRINPNDTEARKNLAAVKASPATPPK